ncbi:class I fructose-bisphosphate aldolase [Candidatus Endowatersipora endosymbiont of Watersipora subatra]|uniref:class I fructose-bisphosphate aldolase n=1 Tax=Candidatus Endowatersipora endosymbiont of Watersipora subatra TaxID=3077946 RepID=UPI00312C81E8
MRKRIEEIAETLVRSGQGILAADESNNTIKKRFDSIGIENTEYNRRSYRELLFRTKGAMNDNISGVILFEETLYQKAKDGTSFVDLIREANAIPGVKADRGSFVLAGHPGEIVTEGLDGLRDRLIKYYESGAQFAKWRAVITINDALPSLSGIKANAHALARYASVCQDLGIVPIVEPEVKMDSEPADHTIERCEKVTSAVLKTVFDELHDQQVLLEGIILKPNMVLPGIKCCRQSTPDEVSAHTVRVLKRYVPSAVPGIAFLSGGQSDIQATSNLAAINAQYDMPWTVTYSYGRALQASCLKIWGGQIENTLNAQKTFAHRARMNGLATLGKWDNSQEKSI